MLKKLFQTTAAVATLAIVGATRASAEVCLIILCLGGGGGGNDPPPAETAHAPEIDVTQGFAALAIVACVALLLREAYNRKRHTLH